MRRVFLPILLLLFGCFACEDGNLLEPELEISPEMGRVPDAGGAKLVAVPFKADLSVWDHSDYSDTRCGGFPALYLTMRGSGEITHLGRITTEMTFCCNVLSGRYWDTDVVFVAANGDELYGEIPEGWIVPNPGEDSDYYQTMFDDPGVFTGGTGRFQGASGEWMTNAWVHDDADGPEGPDEWRTDFFSTGTLILEKGKNHK
jgi:hypothetical protein